jgi:heptosyltransferase-2
VLLGGKEDVDVASELHKAFPTQTLNMCGKMSLNQSASIIKQSKKVITSDTGLMHIAAAYKKNIISIWGNTIPEFGMGPYMAGDDSQIVEVNHLSCRPCSKLGYRKCPKGHFKCMNEIDLSPINL